jgi:diguanylate cyclase (GGDEF)-like protein
MPHETPESSLNTDLRSEISRVLDERGHSIVSESIATFPYVGRQPLEPDYCEGLGRHLLHLLSAAIDGQLQQETDRVNDLQRLINDRMLPAQHLFSFMHLIERTALDEIGLDTSIGAAADPWPLVAQIIRKASFDVLAAYWDRAERDPKAPVITDKLTTLYSRAMLDVVLPTEVQRSERLSVPIALIMFDVDRLAQINQKYGHGVGDRVLERLGILIRTFFRQEDWVFRHGEDSIAVLLTQVSSDDAYTLAARVVAMVEQRLGFNDHNTDGRVSVTVSAAAVWGQGSATGSFDGERLLADAETAIKRAKSLGRNRVERIVVAGRK